MATTTEPDHATEAATSQTTTPPLPPETTSQNQPDQTTDNDADGHTRAPALEALGLNTSLEDVAVPGSAVSRQEAHTAADDEHGAESEQKKESS